MYRSKVKRIVQKKNYRSIYTLNIYMCSEFGSMDTSRY